MSRISETDPAQALFHALNQLRDRALDDAPALSEKPTETDVPSERYFGFQLGSLACAVPARVFCELLASPDIAPLPNAPQALKGLCNVRGLLVPVYSLHKQLDIPEPTVTRVLLIGQQQDCIGLLIDSLPVNLALAENGKSVESLQPDTPLHDLFIGVQVRKNLRWHLLNVSRLGQLLANISPQTTTLIHTDTAPAAIARGPAQHQPGVNS